MKVLEFIGITVGLGVVMGVILGLGYGLLITYAAKRF